MKKTLFYIIFLSLISVSSCQCGRSMNFIRVRKWLDNRSGKSYMNVEGKWSESEWGEVFFIQKHNKLTGKIGSYNLEGSLNGKKMYLVMTSGQYIYYKAILEAKSEKMFIGYYYGINHSIRGAGTMIVLEKK